MAKFESTYSGALIQPGGGEIAPGATVDLSADEQKNAAVAEWIEVGWLKPVSGKGAKASGDKA